MRAVSLAMLLATAALAACGKGAPVGAKAGPGAAAPTATAPSGCSNYAAGTDGLFCDGPGSIEVQLGDDRYSLKGGSCERIGGHLHFRIGVSPSLRAPAPFPDWVDLSVPDRPSFDTGLAGVQLGGRSLMVHTIHGAAGPGGVSFTGTVREIAPNAPDIPISGTFTC